MNYLKHVFGSDFILIAGVFGLVFYALYDAIKKKRWKWAVFLAILPLGFISVPLYLLFGFGPGEKHENTDDTAQAD